MSTKKNLDHIVLESEKDILKFEKNTGKLVSFLSKSAPEQEFIAIKEKTLIFVLQYLDDNRVYKQLSSEQAQKTEINYKQSNNKSSLAINFRNLDGNDIDVFVKITASPEDRFTHWAISLRNNEGLLITDIQFPYIIVSYNLKGAPGEECLLQPFNGGRLLKAPKPNDLEPDNPYIWQFHPENGDANHYPGLTFAQFLAWYNDKAGIYISSQDKEGRIKLIKPVHHGSGIRLGISHIGDWPQNGSRTLEYDVVLGSFTGNWYDAAGLYRDWSLNQHWAKKPLFIRKDVPSWLIDSPPHIIIRLQGQLDVGPVESNEEFLPYPKIVPLLQKISDYIKTPLVPVIMAWEHQGPWIYPDCFPPVGGEDSLREFCRMAKEHEWHVGSFCNGTRWVVGHYWNNYDGEAYFQKHQGDKAVCKTHEQLFWRENWDRRWRPSYPCCINVKMTHDIAKEFVKKLIGWGLDWIQFLDQNVGVSSFPCFAKDHGHPPTPGKWMTEKMVILLDDFQKMAQIEKNNNREIVFSVECSPNEYFLPFFQVCDIRVFPPGHKGHGKEFIPLFNFLYHEFIIMQGGFGNAPEPYHMPIRTAYNLVVGEIPGAVLKGDGKLLNKDTINWAPWNPQIGSNEDSLEMLRTCTILRQGEAKDFLVFGKMLKPSNVRNINSLKWQDKGLYHQVPAVFHSAWQSPTGEIGLVFTNWTNKEQQISLYDKRIGSSVLLSISAKKDKKMTKSVENGHLNLSVPSLSCALVVGLNGSFEEKK